MAGGDKNALVGWIERMVSRVRTDRRSANIAGLIASLATWGVYFSLLWPRMLYWKGGDLYSGWRTVWADWSHHFAYANVFAYRPVSNWFSNHPLFVGKTLDYPFIADAVSGLLMRVGVDRVWAFLVPSVAATLALVALLYTFYLLLLHRPLRALLAMTLFFANGGLGFIVFASDVARARTLDVLLFPPREYSFLRDLDIEWANIVSTQILPQRGLLLGLVVGLAVLIPITRASRVGFVGTSNLKLVGLGVLSGALLVTYAHAYLSLVILCGLLLVFNLRCYKPWLVFAGAAAVSSLTIFLFFYSNTAVESFLGWYPGWMTNSAENRDISLWRFLWLNWGVFLPLAAVSFVRFRYYRNPLVLGGAILFVSCFLVRFMPHAWDNNKVLTWAHLLLCVPVAHYLAHLWKDRDRLTKLVAVILFVATTATGSIELWRLTRTDRLTFRMFSSEEIELAESFRKISRPQDVVVSSDHHHHWVPSLAGRRVLLGYRGWLGSWGIDYREVESDVRTMLAATEGTDELLQDYDVAFVVIGPTELDRYAANEAYWLENHELVLESDSHKVFAVTPLDRREPRVVGEPPTTPEPSPGR